MSSMIIKVLIFLLITNEICCETQNFENQSRETSDNRIKIDVKQKYNVTLEGINAALDEARWTQIVTLLTIANHLLKGSVQDQP